MAYPTFKPIVDEVITLMGQVAGSGVQAYSEPLVKIAINRIFGYLWEKRKWEHLWEWKLATIGTDGKFNTALDGVQDYTNVTEIRDADTHRSIPLSPDTRHLYVTGSNPLFYTVLPWTDAQADTRFFKFWPIGTSKQVELFCGYRPEEFVGDDDIVPMNKELIIHGAVWFMLADDGTNPASADKFQGMFDLTYQNIVTRINGKPIGRGAGQNNGQTVFIR